MSRYNIISFGQRARTTVRRQSLLPLLAPPETSENRAIRRSGEEAHERSVLIEGIVFGAALVVSAALGLVMGNLL